MKRAIPQFSTPLPLATLRVDSKQKTYSFGPNTPFIKLIAVFLIIAGHTIAILGTEPTCQRVALNDSLPTNRAGNKQASLIKVSPMSRILKTQYDTVKTKAIKFYIIKGNSIFCRLYRAAP